MKSSFKRTAHREVEIKREKGEVSPSPSPCPRYPPTMEYNSTIKVEPDSMDQSIIVQWKEKLELKDQEIQLKNEEIKLQEQEIQSLREDTRVKNEDLRLAREEIQSKEGEDQSKENLIQSQCEEISKLKLNLEKQVGEVNTLKADVDLLKEKNEEKEKNLSKMKITQESSTEELARMEENVKSLEAHAVALQENVNQVTVEKELVEMKSCKLQRLNESLRGQLERENDREIDLEKLRSFLDSGRAEIAEMREEVRWMKLNGCARCHYGAAINTDMELFKMKESLTNLKAENQKVKTSWAVVEDEKATLKRDLHELQQAEDRLRWEVRRLKWELDTVRKENNNNVRGQNVNNNNTRGQVSGSGCTGWCKNQGPSPMIGVTPQPAVQIVPKQLENGFA